MSQSYTDYAEDAAAYARLHGLRALGLRVITFAYNDNISL